MKSAKSENNEGALSLELQLREAITASRILQVNKLIRAGANVDYISDGGQTLLHIALQEGKTSIAKKLIDAGARTDVRSIQNDNKTAAEMLHEMFCKHVVGDSEIEATKSQSIFTLATQVCGLNYVDAEGQTFLSYAIQYGQFTLAKKLIDAGAQKIPLPDGTTIDELINDVLNKAIVVPGLYKYMEIISLIDIAVDLNHIDKDGWTYLHLALKQHDILLANNLIEKGANKDVVSKNDEAITPIDLMNLALSTIKNPAMCSIIQSMGANVNNINSEGWTPLHLALINGNTELAIGLFHNGVELVQSRNSSKQTPGDIINEQTLLHKSILGATPSRDILVGLVSIGANINFIDENGWAPLHLALKENKVALAKTLIQNGADKEIVSKNDAALTPLAYLNAMLCKAIWENNSIAQITELIELGASVNNVDQDGWAPLHIALKQENIEIVDLLIKNGANKDAISQNNEKKTPADIINDKDYLNNLVLEDLGINKLKILIKLGPDVEHIDACGSSPLSLALKKENLAVAKLLLKAGANRDQTSSNLMNELLCKLTLESPSRSEITELIDMGADVNYFNQDDLTPLHLALKKGSIPRVKLLIKHGANINISSKNNDVKSPADIVNELQIDLFSVVDNNVSDKSKESLILFKGPDTENFKTFTDNPKHNLFHPLSLEQYFNLQEFDDFNAMLGAIQLLASADSKINLVIDSHGMPTTPYTIKTTYGPDQTASDILDSIIKVAGGKPIKLLTTCCFGERLHSCDSELGSKMPNGSMIITLSKQDRTTQAPDYCHKNIPYILDALFNGDGGNYLKLEHLLEAYCLSQRFNKNTPKVSLFNGSTQKIISLKDYFNTNILKVNNLEISKTMRDLLDIMGLSKDDFDSMLCEISSNSNIKIQESLWRIPNSVSDIKNISQYLNGDTYNELLELYKGYFINNDAIKTLPSERVTKSAYTFHKIRGFGGDYHHTVKHGTPLLACTREKSRDFDEIDATPKHSMLLAVAADHLVMEIGSGSFFSEWELS